VEEAKRQEGEEEEGEEAGRLCVWVVRFGRKGKCTHTTRRYSSCDDGSDIYGGEVAGVMVVIIITVTVTVTAPAPVTEQ